MRFVLKALITQIDPRGRNREQQRLLENRRRIAE